MARKVWWVGLPVALVAGGLLYSQLLDWIAEGEDAALPVATAPIPSSSENRAMGSSPGRPWTGTSSSKPGSVAASTTPGTTARGTPTSKARKGGAAKPGWGPVSPRSAASQPGATQLSQAQAPNTRLGGGVAPAPTVAGGAESRPGLEAGAGSAAGPSTPPPRERSELDTAKMRGAVRSDAGAPVEGALCTWLPLQLVGYNAGSQPETVRSASDGSYYMEHLPHGAELIVQCIAEGYITGRSSPRVATRGFTSSADVILTQAAAGEVSGRVVDSEGRPVAARGVFVALPDRGDIAGVTDGAGRYALAGVPAGRRSVSAWVMEGERTASVSVDVVAGQRIEAPELEVTAWNARVSGRVLDDTQRGVPRAAVTLSIVDQPAQRFSAVTGEDGVFVFDPVPQDYYRLEAAHPAYCAGIVDRLRAPAEGLEVSVDSGTVLEGQVLRLSDGEAFVQAQCVEGEGGKPCEEQQKAAAMTRQGSFRLEVAEGVWNVVAIGPNGHSGSVKNNRVGCGRGRDRLSIDLQRGPVFSAQVVDAVDDSVIVGATVSALVGRTRVQARGDRSYGSTRTDEEGRFEVILPRDEPPGIVVDAAGYRSWSRVGLPMPDEREREAQPLRIALCPHGADC